MTPRITGLHHDHVDGSAAVLDVLDELHALSGKDPRFPTPDALRAFFGNPHEDIVQRFAAVTSLMQTEETLALAGYAYGRRRSREGYRYVEARFAPQYHVFGGLTMTQAAAAMCRGLWDAQSKHGIRILPMLCIGREAAPEVGVDIARIALDYDGAVALDLACDEAANPPEKHLPAYQLTFGTKVRRDCHAGEWVTKAPTDSYRARLLRNVRTAVETLRVDGIGHGIPLPDDPELVARVVGDGIRVSGCPLSNVVCQCIGNVRELRIDELLDRGVIYSLNADDDLFLPTMDDVIRVCGDAYGFSPEQWEQLERNVWRGAFAADVRHS